MNKTIFESNLNIDVKKNRNLTIAAAAGALTGLCGVVLDERSTTKTIAATAIYGAAATALIDATVTSESTSTAEAYIAFGLMAGATSLMGCYFNGQFGDQPETEQ